MTKFNVGDTVYLTGGFPVEDGLGDLYGKQGVIEQAWEADNYMAENYNVFVNQTVVVAHVDHLTTALPYPTR